RCPDRRPAGQAGALWFLSGGGRCLAARGAGAGFAGLRALGGSLSSGGRRGSGDGWRRPSRRRVRAIRDRLRLVYGVPLAKPHGHPIAELILTVLSQSTNDRNRDVAYLALQERFPTWEEIRDAPVDEIEAAIRPGGISKVKSARIKSILRAITERERPEGAEEPAGCRARPGTHARP